MELKKVLIIEDDDGLRSRYKSELEGKVELYFAGSLREAQNMVRQKITELDVISFDLFLAFEEPDDIPKNTMDLILEVKKAGFQGMMLASSDTELYRKDQMKAGCGFENKNKRELASYIMSILENNK